MKVIFLGYDGVIVTAPTRYASGDPWCIYWLNYIIEHTGASIVVSSTWRMGRTLAELQKQLNEWGVKGTVIDKTMVNHTCIMVWMITKHTKQL